MTARLSLRHAAGPLALSLVAVAAGAQTPAAGAQPRGKAIYDRWCAGCHGDKGAGDGHASTRMLPRPRDFTRGVYQIRTTASGELPTDADLRHVVAEGMPGTAMPGWKGRLSDAERDDVIAYVKRFSNFFEGGAAPTPLAAGKAPRSTAEGIAEGRKVYTMLECFKCHGQAGRGDGTSAPTLTDDWKQPIRAADLAHGWNFNGGSSVEQIYMRLRTGLDGTPMPSFSDALDQKLITEDQLWRVAQYVRSLSPERTPEVREVVRAALARGPLPSGPDDSAWASAEPYFVPLVGQVIAKPRWFAPMVDGVWVQAMHDGARLAVKLTWDDPSRSPARAWDQWLGRVSKAMSDVDGPVPAAQGPDRLVVQFARAEDADPPYFLGGDSRRPVFVWRWASAPDRLEEGTESGLGRFTARSGGPAVTHAARYDRGEWRIQLTRALAPADTAPAPAFHVGQATPIAFFAADGSNGEGDARGSVSAWYAIYLDAPTPARVYVIPAVTTLFAAGLGVVLVAHAQQRNRNREPSTTEEE